MNERVGKRLANGEFHGFETLFNPEEGRLGVVVTFLSILELAKEQLLEIVQEAPLAPIYVKSLAAGGEAANDAELPQPTSDEDGLEDSAASAAANDDPA